MRCRLEHDVNFPQAWAGGFTCSMEDGLAVGVCDCEARFGEGGNAIGIAELADADETVGEAWYNVARASMRGGQGM